jgi:hypothetical protein
MSEEKEELKPKEKLESLMEALIGAGILMIIVAVLTYILRLLQNPIYILILIIENVLIKVLGESAAVPLSLTIILFIAAGIVKIGTFLKDEEEQDLYEALIHLFWIIDLIALFLSGIGYTLGLVSAALVIGLGFILFIAPPLAFGIIKGLDSLYKKIQ